MTLPAFVFGFFVSTLYGAAFHLWKNGNLLRLLLYLVLSWLGFILGHVIAGLLGWEFLDLGPLHFGIATLGSLLFLSLGHWLSLVQVERT